MTLRKVVHRRQIHATARCRCYVRCMLYSMVVVFVVVVVVVVVVAVVVVGMLFCCCCHFPLLPHKLSEKKDQL